MTDARTTLKQYRLNLIGRTIKSVNHFTRAASEAIGKDSPALVLTLDDGMMVLVRLDKDLEQ